MALLRVLALSAVLFVAFAEKGVGMGGWEEEPNPHAFKKPTYTSNELYCNGCQGMVRECLRKLRHRTSEADVVEAMTDICDMWQYAKYEFPPPEFKKACESLIADFDEVFEYGLVNRYALGLDAEQYICHDVTGACAGDIDVEFHPPEDAPDPEEEAEEAIFQEEKAKAIKEGDATKEEL